MRSSRQVRSQRSSVTRYAGLLGTCATLLAASGCASLAVTSDDFERARSTIEGMQQDVEQYDGSDRVFRILERLLPPPATEPDGGVIDDLEAANGRPIA